MAYSMGMQQPLFRFSLIDSVGAQVLTHSPNQWDDQEFSNKRDMQYFGVIRNYVTELEFVLESAKAVRTKLYDEGVDAQLTLRIEKYNKSTRVYFIQYEGDIDFSTVEDERTKIIASLIDGGINSKIQAYKNLKYQIPITDNDVELNIGGVDVNEWADILAAGSGDKTPTNDRSFILPTQVNNSSIVLGGVELRDQQYLGSVRLPPSVLYDFSTGDNFFLRSNIIKQIKIDYSFTVSGVQSNGYGWKVNIVDSSSNMGAGVNELFNTVSLGNGSFNEVNFSGSKNITVFPGRNYFLIVEATGDMNFANAFLNVVQSNFKLAYIQSTEPSIIKAKKPNVLFKEIISKINGIDTDVVSSLLDNWDNLLITSGNAIRNLPDPTVDTSFNSFFTSITAVLSAGFSLNDNVPTIERIGYFFEDDYLIHDFGEISEFKLSPLTEVMNSIIKVGYEKSDYEIEKGKEEFNNGQEYSTPIVRVQTTLNLISDYRADQYGIDQIRIKEIQRLANVNDTDLPSDNDVFFILANKTPVNGVYSVMGPSYFDEPPSGVSPRTTSYNYLISPKHNLIRNMAFIKSSFYGINDQGSINFQSADKNAELSVVKDGITVSEKSNINLADYPDRLFLPFLVEFDTDYKTSIQNMVDMGNRGVIRFSHRGVVIEGFIYSVDISASKNNQTTFTVILSKNNNLQDLIF